MGIKTWNKSIRPLVPLDNCLGVVLSKGAVAIIDLEDKKIAEIWNWSESAKDRNGAIYAQRKISNNKKVYLHNEIFGSPSDHIDGNPLNNRRSNLRAHTSFQNSQNRKIASNNTSGFKGVSLRRERGAWRALIKCQKTTVYLGTYSTAIEAAIACDTAARELHKEFATLNFPKENEQSVYREIKEWKS